MHTADNAIVTENSGGGHIRYKTRCPKCGRVDETWPMGQMLTVNAKGKSTIQGSCICGHRFIITFYGV